MRDVHSRRGGFDSVRLLAALMVFHSHAYALAGMNQPTLPGGTFGAVAVVIFFVVSGYWVTQSALQRSLASYGVARALRIVPGLAVCCAVTIAICSLAASQPINDYFRSPQTWSYMWSSFPFFHPPMGGIPGTFEDGPVRDAANGSLWTLRYEVLCYVLVAAAAVFGPKGVRGFMIAAGLFGVAAASQTLGVGVDPLNTRYVILLDYFQIGWIAVFVGAFAFGAWLHGADDRRLTQVMAVSAVAMALGWKDAAYAQVISIFLWGSIAVWVGRHTMLDRQVTRGQDISYGVYIYAFPCQQLAVRFFKPYDGGEFLPYYGAALAATVTLAALSWLLVERPALLLKNPLAFRLERLLAVVTAKIRPLTSARDHHLADQAGGLAVGVDAEDPHAVGRRRTGH